MASIKRDAKLGSLLAVPAGLHVVYALREKVELEQLVREEVVCHAPRSCASVVENQMSLGRSGKLLPLGDI